MDIVSTYDFTRAQGRATYDGRPSQDSRYQKDIELGNLPLPAARQQDVSAQNNQHFQQGSAETLVQTSNKPRDATKSARPRTAARSWWVCITWSLTWWIPTCCIATVFGKRRPDVQMAWREKVALCVIIFLMCATMLFFIIGLGRILCPRQNVLSEGEVSQFNTLAEPFVVVFGNYYRIADVVQSHVLGGNAYLGAPAFMSTVLGRDVSAMFYPSRLPEKYCPGMNLPAGWDNVYNRNNQGTPQIWYGHLQSSPVNNKTIDYLANMAYMKKGQIARSKEWISSFLDSDGNHKIIVAWGKVYDITTYYDPSNVGAQATSPGFFGNLVKQIFDAFSQSSNRGRDATDTLNQLKEPRYGGPVFFAQFRTCMDNMFYTGVVDTRTDLKCVLPNYIMLAASCVLVLVIGFKFVGALQLNGRSNPEDHTKFVICQVPCYTEGEDSLRRTINSLACTQYSDSRKLLFIICDGMIIGAGNDRPTPRIVLDILGVDEDVDPEPQSFQSLGKASKQHNMGKVYSGLYDVEGHLVPFIVIVKVGTPSERVKPGNRGKRDSQLVLMRFLNRVHFAAPLAPLELEMFHHMKNIIGVPPMMYEYVLMVDADTEVLPDSLNMLVSSMIIDGNIMGICGETQLSNENDSWVTMIQVYEYYISHHLSKAFESLFGSVTCLPGCFCMYRLRSSNGKNTPLLVSPQVLADYSENNVDTLHLKNLLELGEDRYLTTLLLKHFPTLKTKFVQGALCQTGAPDRWSVLLSQRRRWINSTVHNLFELVFLSELCGVCCFSMRFVVLIDLFATFLQPASIIYVLYLIYVAAFDKATAFPMISLIMLACIYGLQMIIFLIKREWQHVGWMIIYILAMPVFGFFVPLYAFWHFDDFSWGNTRLAAGAGGDAGAEHGGSKRGGYADDAEMFDPQSIPVESWESYEARAGWVQAAGTSTGYATADADRIMATALLTDLERRDSNMRLDDQVDAVSIGSRSAGLAYQGQQQMSTAAAGGGPRLGSTRSSRPIQYPPPLMMPAAPPAAGAVADSASIYTRHRHHRETDRMSQTSHSSHGSHHSHGSHGSHGSHRKHAARQHAANTSYRSQGSQGVGSSQPYKPQAYYDPLHPSSAHPRSQLNQQSVSSPQSAGVMYPPQALVATSSPMSPTSSTVQHQPLPLLPLSTRSQPPSQASQLQPPMADRGRILEAVQSFIQASDLSTITKRHVRERVMQELGLDAVASRRVVDDCIRTVLADLDG
ncbi:chitin synthase-domain-containing protein [Entophlyctis helioformis]|nr:chitin synthase-domain-containing protein [Entophlyctis helioformis]